MFTSRNQDPLSCLSLFNQQYIQKYAHIIDEKDPSRGVDNYASSVMDLIKSARNKKGMQVRKIQPFKNRILLIFYFCILLRL